MWFALSSHTKHWKKCMLNYVWWDKYWWRWHFCRNIKNMVRAIKNVYSRCCIVCASYKWFWNLQQKKNCSKKEIVTVNESKDGSDVLVEDEKKPKGCWNWRTKISILKVKHRDIARADHKWKEEIKLWMKTQRRLMARKKLKF